MRSELVTVRCTAKGGCGRWLVKVEETTAQLIVKGENVRTQITWGWASTVGARIEGVGLPVIENPHADPWWLDRRKSALVASGVMIAPDEALTPTEAAERAPDELTIRCTKCGISYQFHTPR